MNWQKLTVTFMSLFLTAQVAGATTKDGALQGPDGKARYFHSEGDEVIVTICPDRVYLEGRNSCANSKELPRVSVQQFANYLKLIMLSDRVKFEIADEQADVDLYKKHGSLKNLEVLKRRQAQLESALAASKQDDEKWAKRKSEVGEGNITVPPSKTPQLETALKNLPSLLGDHDQAETAIRELDERLTQLVDKISEQTPENPMRLTIKKGEPASLEAVLLDSYVNDPTVPVVFIPVRVEKFRMGSPEGEKDRDNDEKSHDVTLTQDIWVMATEMAGEQLKALGVPDNTFEKASNFKGANLPREMVSWEEADKVVKWLNAKQSTFDYQLLTEAQWEYVARAGSDKAFCFGDFCEKQLNENAWSAKNSDDTTHAVASLLPNAFGVFDMIGNVWEWCHNWYDENYSSLVENPASGNEKAGSSRVVRGGGWNSSALYLRSANRGNDWPGFRNGVLGFRLVRTPK